MYTGSNILHWKMAIDENGRVEYGRPYDMQKAYHCDKGGDMNTLI